MRAGERAADGAECDWGRVAAWEPTSRVVLLWQITAEWKFDPDFETEGCFLLSSEEARRRFHRATSYISTQNGRGPHAWHAIGCA